ncbi:MBL fold metallo-hydrolase [Curtobacterium ammoniigenes]|uniref:MBL fold metallo-hydrolase n=1 Tax=Curtobacterium ammoniigenes TaxID=395387 RepID=UPI0008343C9A|nr:MBL fold metallo-hydrolase [Curtobacterium ammoniigenes]
MRVTKLEHACLIVTEGDAALVIDPGNYTRPVDASGVVAVVITHEHPDHITSEQLRRILGTNPEAVVLGPPGVASALRAEVPDVAVDVIGDGALRTVGPFTLRFFGTKHERIHASVPLVDNTGVLINDRLFYPGDAYTNPGVPVDLLVCPVGAPWLKVGEMMDYVSSVAPARSMPTHEGTLSAAGFDQATMRLAQATEPHGTAVIVRAGESITV